MNILTVNNFYSNIGGSEKQFLRTASILKDNGHNVFFFSSNREPFFQNSYQYLGFFPQYVNYSNVQPYLLPLYAIKSIYNTEAKKKFSNYIKVIKPDIIHIHNISFVLTSSIMQVCSENKIPVVMTLHNPYLVCPSVRFLFGAEHYCRDNLCLKGDWYNCIKHRCFDKNIFKSTVAAIEYWYRQSSKSLDPIKYFIIPSKALYDLIKSSGLSETRLKLIPNTLDNLFLVDKPEYREGKYFLYSGRLSPEKGLDTLIESMKKVPKEVKLKIAGDGSMKTYLSQFIIENNLTNVELLGFKSDYELRELYKNSIACVMPTKGFETFGLSVLEAFASSRPAIASNIGGLPELVEDNVTGYLIEPENVNMLSQRLIQMSANPDIVNTMGEKARLKAEKYFKPDIFYSNLMEVYNSALSS